MGSASKDAETGRFRASPESVHPPTQSSPKTVGRPTSATRGDAQTRRGRQQAERCHRMGISGRTCGDAGLQKVLFLLWRVEARSDTALAASHNVGLPPPAGSIRLFLSPPSFFFTHEKERWGAGGSQPRIARGVVPRIPTLYSIGVNQEATSPFALARRRLMGESEGERCFAGERCSPPTR